MLQLLLHLLQLIVEIRILINSVKLIKVIATVVVVVSDLYEVGIAHFFRLMRGAKVANSLLACRLANQT